MPGTCHYVSDPPAEPKCESGVSWWFDFRKFNLLPGFLCQGFLATRRECLHVPWVCAGWCMPSPSGIQLCIFALPTCHYHDGAGHFLPLLTFLLNNFKNFYYYKCFIYFFNVEEAWWWICSHLMFLWLRVKAQALFPIECKCAPTHVYVIVIKIKLSH